MEVKSGGCFYLIVFCQPLAAARSTCFNLKRTIGFRYDHLHQQKYNVTARVSGGLLPAH
jgi:hypothetical protein